VTLFAGLLTNVLALRELAPSDTDMIKVDYLEHLHELENPDGRYAQSHHGPIQSLYMQLSYELSASIYQARRALNSEPDRSRRVLRLIVANWLAHYGTPRPGRARPRPRL